MKIEFEVGPAELENELAEHLRELEKVGLIFVASRRLSEGLTVY